MQARHLGVDISLDPWLSAPVKTPCGPVIARSSRYHNPTFPWRRIRQKHPKAVFVGLENEHKEFEERYGPIRHVPTPDLLVLAQMIAGTELLITNQTAAFWIGAGLGVPMIQESYIHDLNSVVERDNIRYTRSVSEVNALLESL